MFTLCVIKTCDSIFVNLSLKEVSSVFMFDNISNLFQYSISIFDDSSLFNFFDALSDIAIFNFKIAL